MANDLRMGFETLAGSENRASSMLTSQTRAKATASLPSSVTTTSIFCS
jgi:hypothetical protein